MFCGFESECLLFVCCRVVYEFRGLSVRGFSRSFWVFSMGVKRGRECEGKSDSKCLVMVRVWWLSVFERTIDFEQK